jgi:hypothetical protein
MTFEDFVGFLVGRLQVEEKKWWVSNPNMGALWRSVPPEYPEKAENMIQET